MYVSFPTMLCHSFCDFMSSYFLSWVNMEREHVRKQGNSEQEKDSDRPRQNEELDPSPKEELLLSHGRGFGCKKSDMKPENFANYAVDRSLQQTQTPQTSFTTYM